MRPDIGRRLSITTQTSKRALVKPIPVWVLLAVVTAVGLGGAGFWLYRHYAPAPSNEVQIGGDADAPATRSSDEQQKLLEAYAPALVLPAGESWRPLPVDRFVVDACVSRLRDNHWSPCTKPAGLGPDNLPRGTGRRLDLATCAIADGPECYENDASAQHSAPVVVYGRFWRNNTGAQRHIGYVLQYWLFYYFNDWQNSEIHPTLWQFHEGDWEEVSVGLARDLQPVYVAASSHCTGHFRFWNEVKIRGKSHPTIYVARGSHANYFAADSYPSPRKCLPKFLRKIIKKLGIDPRDVTGDGSEFGFEGEQPIKLELRTEDAPWLPFQGAWGEGEFVRWKTRDGSTRRRAGGTSPRGPAQKGIHWSNPVHEALINWPQDPVTQARASQLSGPRG